jgi:GNAT superfamily N-acetyltransferase
MQNYEIIKLKPEDYHKCSNIWDMAKNNKLAETFFNDLISGNRLTFVYIEGDEFLGEASIVFERNDTDYCIPGQRIYFSRLIVKESHRNHGIGGILVGMARRKGLNKSGQTTAFLLEK